MNAATPGWFLHEDTGGRVTTVDVPDAYGHCMIRVYDGAVSLGVQVPVSALRQWLASVDAGVAS